MENRTDRRRIQKIQLRPSDIYFSQEYMNNRFEDGELIGERLDDLVYERISVKDIRTIRVVKVHGKCFTPDNRRLWVFRNLQKLNEKSYPFTIPVDVWNNFETEQQLIFAARNNGYDIRIRDNLPPGGEEHKKVTTIDSTSYKVPPVLRLQNAASVTFYGVKVSCSFVWNMIVRPAYSSMKRLISKQNANEQEQDNIPHNILVEN